MRNLKVMLSVVVPLIILVLPLSWFPIEGMTVVEQRVIALFVMATLLWVLEPIPIFATSVLIIVLELLMISNQGFILFRQSSLPPEQFGKLLDYQSIFHTFASPIILLFLGGFFLAISATKYKLDQTLANLMLKPFGTKPRTVILGLMVITALFSMFMSNTATTVLMLSILTPVLAMFPDNDKGKIALVLCIPLGANIGGIGTPIGTPPNAIALQYLKGENAVSFFQWMSFAVPYVIVMLLISWVLLNVFYPATTKKIKLDIEGDFQWNRNSIIVCATFFATIFLWLTDFIHGMNSYIVAMLPVAVFTASGVVTKYDLKQISWNVLWLVSGGIALGVAMDKSGLAQHFVESIPFSSFSPLVIVGGAAFLTAFMANFMSNTATANLLMPILVALGTSVASLNAIGGEQIIVLTCAISASMGMALPISTPPNALAYGTGVISTKHMARVGVLVGFLGLLLTFLMMYFVRTWGIV